MGALLRKTINPVQDLLVISSPAWSESTFARIVKPKPLASGQLFSTSSTASPNGVCLQSFLGKILSMSKSGAEGSKMSSAL